MKSIEKIIVCVFAIVLFAASSIASFVALCTSGDLDNAISSYHPFSPAFSFIYGGTNKVLGKNYNIDNERNIFLLKNGYMTYEYKESYAKSYEKNFADFNTYLENKNIEFMYVMTADAGDERMGQLPYGVETNHYEESTNILVDIFNRNRIEYIKTFDALKNSDRDYYDYFFKTDHHWNDHAGLFVTKLIVEELNKTYNMNLDASFYDESQYNVKKYKNMFGSYGKKLSLGYANAEKFEMLIPKYKTDFETSLNTKGSYLNSLINKKVLNKKAKVVNYYSSYLFTDQPIIKIKNNLCNNGKRILVIKDSKANVVNAHLASSVEYLDIIDLRHYDDSLKDYIDEVNPDVVLAIYSPMSRGAVYDFS